MGVILIKMFYKNLNLEKRYLLYIFKKTEVFDKILKIF